MPENALDPASLTAQLEAVLKTPEAAVKMARNAVAQGRPDATERLVDLVLSLTKENTR